MSSINCSVVNCSHNDSGICYANKISINGKKSHTSTHTCCTSFLDSANYSNLTNSMNNDGPCSSIGCNVKTCNNNVGNMCALNNIAVTSNNIKANLYSETHCSSFKCK
ncbi:DUF1540 domain-containing protein [Romboutsia sp.]|uniref:DUF1540 domain-containing protein n=1 Tax=Romboutsia sp. TaxID=1965302 RepID=UPI003F37E060